MMLMYNKHTKLRKGAISMLFYADMNEKIKLYERNLYERNSRTICNRLSIYYS